MLDLDKILNYVNPEPKYTGELESLGLIGKNDLKEARNQSIFQGLLGAGLAYAAQPQNQNYGTITPYLAKAGIQGLQSMKSPYEQLTKDALMKDKLNETKYQRDKRLKEDEKAKAIQDILSNGLYKETTTGGQEKPYKPITKQVMSPTGLISEKVAPDFTPIKTTPEKTTYEFNLGAIQDLVKKGGLTEATALMDLAKTQREMLKSVAKGVMLTDAQATSMGLKIDRGQKYFKNKDDSVDLIAGQIIPFDQINKSKYDRVSDSSGTWYIPKDPTSGLKTLRDAGGGQYIEDTYKKPDDPYIATEGQLKPLAIAISEQHDIPVKQAFVVANRVLPSARAWSKDNPNSKVTTNDKAMSLVTELYDVNEPEWWGKSDISSKEQYKIGTILRDEKGNRAIITGYNTETQQPIYQVIK